MPVNVVLLTSWKRQTREGPRERCDHELRHSPKPCHRNNIVQSNLRQQRVSSRKPFADNHAVKQCRIDHDRLWRPMSQSRRGRNILRYHHLFQAQLLCFCQRDRYRLVAGIQLHAEGSAVLLSISVPIRVGGNRRRRDYLTDEMRLKELINQAI